MEFDEKEEEEKSPYEIVINNIKQQLLNSSKQSTEIINDLQTELYMIKLTLNKQKLKYINIIQL